MKTIDSYITEKLKINKDIIAKQYNYHPKDKYELRSIIKKLLDERGQDADLNDIDVSNVTDMSFIFSDLKIHNIDISQWNVSNVENMFCMFFDCTNFNCDLSDWNVSKVENMISMFDCCRKFDSDLSNWDVSNVNDMKDMFAHCDSLKNIPSWYHE